MGERPPTTGDVAGISSVCLIGPDLDPPILGSRVRARTAPKPAYPLISFDCISALACGSSVSTVLF